MRKKLNCLYFRRALWLFFLIANLYNARAQSRLSVVQQKIADKIQDVVLIKTDTTVDASHEMSDTYFNRFSGKIISYIYIQTLQFGEEVNDSVVTRKHFFARIANKIQPGTKEFIIRQHLFIKEGDRIDPHVLADNERYLRDLEFIKDARFYIYTIEGTDSAQLYIFTRDVFSLGASFTFVNESRSRGSLYNANLMGLGQRLQYTIRYNKYRQPLLGSEYYYRKSSIFGTKADLEAGYSEVNSSIISGLENETYYFGGLSLPLFTNHTKVAGSVNLRKAYTNNSFGQPDSTFNKYQFISTDCWAGYNFISKESRTLSSDMQSRFFLSSRIYYKYFSERPMSDIFSINYANRLYLLTELRWFRLNFYKTNYIYGFGRTEDIPVGYTTKFTTGAVRNDGFNAWYMAVSHERTCITRSDGVVLYSGAISLNQYGGVARDKILTLYIQNMTSLQYINQYRYRFYNSFYYFGIFNPFLNNEIIRRQPVEFIPSAFQRITASQLADISSGVYLYTPLSVLNFSIGFFVTGDFTYLANQPTAINDGKGYLYTGGGIRIRNEDLVFGTIQLRTNYGFEPLPGMPKFEIEVSSNLKVKYSGSYVQAPSYNLPDQ